MVSGDVRCIAPHTASGLPTLLATVLLSVLIRSEASTLSPGTVKRYSYAAKWARWKSSLSNVSMWQQAAMIRTICKNIERWHGELTISIYDTTACRFFEVDLVSIWPKW